MDSEWKGWMAKGVLQNEGGAEDSKKASCSRESESE